MHLFTCQQSRFSVLLQGMAVVLLGAIHTAVDLAAAAEQALTAAALLGLAVALAVEVEEHLLPAVVVVAAGLAAVVGVAWLLAELVALLAL